MNPTSWSMIAAGVLSIHLVSCSSKVRSFPESTQSSTKESLSEMPENSSNLSSANDDSSKTYQLKQEEARKGLLRKISQFNENSDHIKMYCRTMETPRRIHHFLFFERTPKKNWSAKVFTEYFDSRGEPLKTKTSTEFPVDRTEDRIQSTEEPSRRQLHLEFPTINALAEVTLRPRYEGDRSPQSIIPKEKKLTDVECFENY